MRLFYLQNQHRIGQSVTDQFKTPAIGQSVTGQFDTPAIGQTLSDQFNAPTKSQTASGQLAIFQTLTGKLGPAPPRPFTLGWSHYVFLLRIENPEQRSCYDIEATDQTRPVRQSHPRLDSGLYERLAL